MAWKVPEVGEGRREIHRFSPSMDHERPCLITRRLTRGCYHWTLFESYSQRWASVRNYRRRRRYKRSAASSKKYRSSPWEEGENYNRNLIFVSSSIGVGYW